MKKALFILLVGVMSAGCVKYDVEEILLVRSDISLTMKGNDIYSFNPDKAQIGYNSELNEYRMFDEDFQNWVSMIWSEKPVSEGQVVLINLEWDTRESARKKTGLEFEVRKTDGSGMVWLWNSSDKIGLAIKDF
ncbi:MAG: hypothetical protein IKB85_08750 [Bacteroidales bacterium]|nr:hypothetical protein [Bacteroidales bacterium]